jgi:hypothetical protein
MKLIMTLLVRDEADIIETNIDYHLSQGVDFFIVTDNLSIDETPLILQQYVDKGLMLVINETDDDYSQHKWVTRMANIAYSDYAADWVINNDADEFWLPDKFSLDTLKSVLSSLALDIVSAKVERKNFIPQKNDSVYFLDKMTIREATSFNTLGKPLPPKVCHRALPNIDVSQGNHSVSVAGKPLTSATVPLVIFHFPLRSYRQFENKIIKGGSAYLRNRTLHKNIGRTWRELYDIYLDGTLKEYYEQQIFNESYTASLISDGTLIEDNSLLDYIKKYMDYNRLSNND